MLINKDEKSIRFGES